MEKPYIIIKQLDDLTLEISTDFIAKNVFLTSDNQVFYDDNFFDLLANEKKIIKLSKKAENIRWKTLFEVMK
uniref:glycoside hydrolase family 2 protein n=1 Tax=Flavobacterium sp. TaxID=239 RepID=UPI0040492155